jgi:exodeoxyribonuclease VII small subunit
MAAKKKIESESNFEKDLEVLEKIVEELEEGGLPLDVSIKKFEEGMRLAQRCDKALSAAEKKIEILTKNADGELEAQPFGEAEGAEAAPAKPEKKRKAPGGPGEDDEDEGEKETGALLF